MTYKINFLVGESITVLFGNADNKGETSPYPTALHRRLPLPDFLGLNSIDSPQIETQNHQHNACPQGAPGQIK